MHHLPIVNLTKGKNNQIENNIKIVFNRYSLKFIILKPTHEIYTAVVQKFVASTCFAIIMASSGAFARPNVQYHYK